MVAGPCGRHRSASLTPGEVHSPHPGDDPLLTAELLEMEPGLLCWPIHTLYRCHQRDVSDPTAVLGAAEAAAIGAPAPRWQMASKYSQSSLPVLLAD